MSALDLHLAVEAVCPIHGVSMGDEGDRSSWQIAYKDEATPAQRAAAQVELASYVQSADRADTAALNRALAEKGAVVRALAELTFQEINRLRVRAGLAAYTKQQFIDALKANMRA